MDIILGDGPHVIMTTRVFAVQDPNHTLTESTICYKAHLESLAVSLVVYDNHEAFGKIKEMITQNKRWVHIEEYLSNLVIPQLPIQHIKTCIGNAYQRGYDKGQTDKQDQIKLALGIREW